LRGFFGRRAVRVVGVVALLVVVVVVLFLILNWYVAPTKPSERKDVVLAVAQILGGSALLSGLYFTWRTLQVNREGQITERFTRAIEQLGATHDDKSKNLELRLGGIYALERIAKESEEDHWSIMEVLTAYVRQHAPWRPEEVRQLEKDTVVERKSEEESGAESETIEVHPPSPDIHAIMTVIGRRTRYFQHGEPGLLDLHETNLSGVEPAAEANLIGVRLSGVNLQDAYLAWANLRRADLSRANLTGAYLLGANLTRAILAGTNLRGADLYAARLLFANIKGACLSEAYDLTQAQLEEAIGDEKTQLPPTSSALSTGS
jgi:hypothetical protein